MVVQKTNFEYWENTTRVGTVGLWAVAEIMGLSPTVDVTITFALVSR